MGGLIDEPGDLWIGPAEYAPGPDLFCGPGTAGYQCPNGHSVQLWREIFECPICRKEMLEKEEALQEMGAGSDINKLREDYKNIRPFNPPRFTSKPPLPEIRDFLEALDREGIWFFKVHDYTTILLGRRYVKAEKHNYYTTHGFYVERGDGTKYEYEDYRVDWATSLSAHILNKIQ